MSYNVPPGLDNYPLDLQRSHLYPKDPAAAGEAVQSYLDGEPTPTYMPQRMMFQRWKTPPYKLAWLSGTIALLAARRREAARLAYMRDIGRYGVETQPVQQVADQYQPMPSPLDYVNPDIDQPVVAQGAPPPNDRISSDELTQFGQEYKARILQLGAERHGKVLRAFDEIQQQITQTEAGIAPISGLRRR